MKQKPAKMTSETKTQPIPAEMSAGQLAGLLGEPHSTIRDICNRGGLESVEGKFPTREAIAAAVKHYESKIGGNADRARKAKAEADSAEIDAIQKAGKFCLLTDAVQFWSEARIEIRQAIEKADYIPAKARERLLTELAKLHPTPPDADRG